MGSILGIRHLQCTIIFIGFTVAFAMRVNLSMAIVAMMDRQNANPDFEEYDWDEKIKSYLLGAFLWGYIPIQIPGGYIAQRFGAKFILFAGLLGCSILNVTTPWCTSFGGWKVLFASRVLQGICQGMLFPSCHVLLSKWCPKEERGVLATYVYSGASCGIVIMFATSGEIAAELGWPSIFYFSGLAGIIWSAIWLFIGASSPASCRMISTEERRLIENSLGKVQEEPKKQLATPWLKVLTSLPFWALLIVHCTNNWGYWTFMTQIPSYMKGVLGMDIKQNALLSALPFFALLIMSFLLMGVAKILIKKQWITVEIERKMFNTFGHWVPMVALIGLGLLTANMTMAVVLLTIGVAFTAAINLGFLVNHIDLAPNFAGTLMGMTNCVANTAGILAPLAVGLIVTDLTDPALWRAVFFIAAGFYFVGNLMFLIFGTTDVQPWNNPKSSKWDEENAEEMKSMRQYGGNDVD